MPLPLIIGGAAVIALAGAGALGSGLSVKKVKGRSVLIVGPSSSGKTSLARVLGDTSLEVRPSAKKRWLNKAVKLVDLDLRVTSIDTPGGREGVEALRSGAERADLICLVVSAKALDASDGWENPERIAKLIGHVAGPKTRCAIVISHADSVPGGELAELLKSPTVLNLLDLTGAGIVLPCNLTDPGTWSRTAEALLTAFRPRKLAREEHS